MTKREKYILKMMEKANKFAREKNWTRDTVDEIWDMCSKWNSEHDYYEEIFMCEHVNEETDCVDGFYIEDDYWITDK